MALCAGLAGCDGSAASTDVATDALADASDTIPPTDVRDAATLPDLPVAMACDIVDPTLTSGRVTVDGTALRDELGRMVILRGANTGGRSKFAPYMPFEFTDDASFTARAEQLAAQIESWGMNVVRLPFTWGAMEPTRGTWDETYLTRYAAVVDTMWRHHVRVLVDFHQDAFAEVLCGDGFPAWTLGSEITYGPPHHDCHDWFQGYFTAGSDVQRAFDRLWNNSDGIADRMEAMWREMATRLGTHPGVIGFEVLNEPGWGTMEMAPFSATVLPRFTERMGRAIQAVAPGALIFQGGPGSDAVGATAMTLPDVTPFVYAPHYYDQFVILGANYSTAGASRARLNAMFDVAARWNRPALLGEFGGPYDSPGIEPMLRDAYDILDRRLAHGTVWEVSLATETWNEEKLDLLDATGTERPYVREVVRGYARAVDGTIDTMRWDAAAHTFLLSVSNVGGSSTTEVFVPVRHVGNTPRIGIDHGCVAWDAATGLLRVRSDATAWTLTVQ